MFLGCLFIELIMNYTSYRTDGYLFKIVKLIDIEVGRYKIFRHRYNCEKYILVSVNRPENLKYQIYKYYNKQDYNIIQENLHKYCIYLEDIVVDLNSKEFDVEEMNKPIPDSKFHLICEINKENFKVFFIEETFNEKIYKYPIYSNINSILLPNTYYPITNFEISNDNIKIKSYVWSNNKIHKKENNNINENHYINKRVIDILKTYFKCENDKIYCVYNNKKEIAKLTLITEDKILTEDGSTKILQSLKLEIGNKKFTFYINNPNVINYKKEGKYCFLTMHIYNNSLYNNLIYGYEFKEDKYYYLKYEEKLILKYTDDEIANNFRMSKNQNLYTYLLSNHGKKCGMIINIDEDNNITHKLVNLNDKCFENILDISLLKPVKEWDNNDYYEINKFDDIIEGFDEEDN